MLLAAAVGEGVASVPLTPAAAALGFETLAAAATVGLALVDEDDDVVAAAGLAAAAGLPVLLAGEDGVKLFVTVVSGVGVVTRARDVACVLQGGAGAVGSTSNVTCKQARRKMRMISTMHAHTC